MSDGIYVGMAGAAARAAQLEAVSDNLANAQTPGFKASRPAFQSFLAGAGNDKILSAAVATGIDRRAGATTPTERELDIVPPDDTFLAVTTNSGQVAYTRNGHVEVGSDGSLMVGGNRLLDDRGEPLTVPVESQVRIDENGDVFADKAPVGRLGIFNIDGPLDRVGPTLLGAGAGAQVTAVDEPKLRLGALELGNAPALEATIQLINTQRNFDTAMQAIQTYRKLDERAIEVGRLR
ncbi:MAG TPA: flagellar hook basal-body protein [Polyangia bacterium]